MSFTLHLDPLRWDFRIGANGRFQLVRGASTVRERLQIILWTYYKEWFLDTSRGIDYYNGQILGQTTNPDMASAVIRRAILSDPDVIKIDTFTITKNNNRARAYAINVTCQVRGTAYDGGVSIIMVTV